MKKYGKLLFDSLAVAGAIATILSTYIAYLALSENKVDEDLSTLKKVQVAAANIIAPEGYFVQAANISVVPENTLFAVGENTSLFLSKEYKFPIRVLKYKDMYGLEVFLNGKRDFIKPGGKKALLGTNCTLWFYNMEKSQHSFELRCV